MNILFCEDSGASRAPRMTFSFCTYQTVLPSEALDQVAGDFRLTKRVLCMSTVNYWLVTRTAEIATMTKFHVVFEYKLIAYHTQTSTKIIIKHGQQF